MGLTIIVPLHEVPKGQCFALLNEFVKDDRRWFTSGWPEDVTIRDGPGDKWSCVFVGITPAFVDGMDEVYFFHSDLEVAWRSSFELSALAEPPSQ